MIPGDAYLYEEENPGTEVKSFGIFDGKTWEKKTAYLVIKN